MKALEDHLVERRLPIEQVELQSIAQNVIQNLIDTERGCCYYRNFLFLISCHILFLAPTNTLVMSPEERQEMHLKRKNELIKRLKSSIYHWQPLR